MGGLGQVVCSGSHVAEIKLAEAKLASYLKALEKKNYLEAHSGFFKNLVPCGCRTDVPIFCWLLARAALRF